MLTKPSCWLWDHQYIHRDLTGEMSVNIHGCIITDSPTIRNLGVIFDSQLTFKSHIKAALIHSFVTSRLDCWLLDYCNYYCNCSGLHKCVTRGLQLAQIAAARILTKTKRIDHVTPVLISLHWLPITARADFKVLLLTFKSLNGLAPLYLSALLLPYSPAPLMLVFWLFHPPKDQQVREHLSLVPPFCGIAYSVSHRPGSNVWCSH